MKDQMIQASETESKPVVIASRDQLLAWTNDGGLTAGSRGAGYSHQQLTPQRIISFIAPVSILEHFDFEQPEKNFPLLIELYNSELCDRTFISFEDVRAVHFRSADELDAFQRFPTPSFGMSEVALLVSPDLFDGNPDDEPIGIQQNEFDESKYQKIESFAGSILFSIHARDTDEMGTIFVRSLMTEEVVELPPLLKELSDYRWARNSGDTPLSNFVSTILNFTFANLNEYRSIDSENAAVAWSERLLDLTREFDALAPDGHKPPSERFKGMANILNSNSALKELSDSSNSFQVMQYAILIALMRRDPKSFLHWKSTASDNCEEVKLATSFLLGLRCGRNLIVDRKIRTEALDKILARAISESMLNDKVSTLTSISTEALSPLKQVRSKDSESKKPTASAPLLGETSIVISGTDLIGIELENLLNGGFTIKIRAATLMAPNAENGSGMSSRDVMPTEPALPANSSAKRSATSSSNRSKTSSSNSSTGRKKVGGYADPSVTLFDVADDKSAGESQ